MGGHPLDADRGGDEDDRAALAADGGVRFSSGLVVARSVRGALASRLHEPHVLRLVILIGLPTADGDTDPVAVGHVGDVGPSRGRSRSCAASRP